MKDLLFGTKEKKRVLAATQILLANSASASIIAE
jgi:hypothetical protein